MPYTNRITRTTADLIAELEGEAKNFEAVGIAVGFEESALFIFADDADRSEKLNAALAEGGRAIGLIGVVQIEETLALSSRLFSEYKGEQWARAFLDELSDLCGQKLESGLETGQKISQLLN